MLQERDRDEPMDLARAPLLRLRLLRFGAEDFTLVLTIHHIVEDGWSAVLTKLMHTCHHPCAFCSLVLRRRSSKCVRAPHEPWAPVARSLRLLLDAVMSAYNMPGVPLPTPPSYLVKLRHEAAVSAAGRLHHASTQDYVYHPCVRHKAAPRS